MSSLCTGKWRSADGAFSLGMLTQFEPALGEEMQFVALSRQRLHQSLQIQLRAAGRGELSSNESEFHEDGLRAATMMVRPSSIGREFIWPTRGALWSIVLKRFVSLRQAQAASSFISDQVRTSLG
jgi:hypothetical protein